MACSRRAAYLALTQRELEEILEEDVGAVDLTTELLGIGDLRGAAELSARASGILSGVEEAAEIYRLAGAEVEQLRWSGDPVEAGDAVLRARGPARSLHRAWRAAQTLVAYASGVATEAHRMVCAAKSANPRAAVATTRQTPPRLRKLYIKAALSGGAVHHRAGLSDSVLVFGNHAAFLDWGRLAELAREASGVRPIGIEVEGEEEALRAAAAGFAYIQIERMPPEDLRRLVQELGRLGAALIGASGDITAENAAAYAAAGVDILVTSAPYRAPPLDFTTRMRRL